MQMVVAFGIVEALPSMEASAQNLTDKYSNARRAHNLPHSWQGSPVAKTTAMQLIQANKRCREERTSAAEKVAATLDRCIGGSVARRIEESLLQPLPLAVSQSIVLAIESLSLCLTAAISEDSSGCSIHFLPTVLSSFIALHCTLLEHRDIVKEFCLCAPTRSHRTLSSFPKYGQLMTSVPATLLAMSVALDEALDRILRAYRDQLNSYSFPPTYASIIVSRLAKL